MAPSSLRPQTGRYSHQHHHHYHQHITSRSSTRQSSNPEVDVDVDMEPTFNSLFGDPVPPPPPDDFLGSTFSTPAFMHTPSMDLTSEEEQILGQTMTLEHSRIPQRLFPQVPYSTLMGRRYSNASSSSPRNFEIMPSAIPRLKPPDIQILPNSSGDSSSGNQNSPNYLLLTPNEMLRNSPGYDKTEEAPDVMELKETYTIRDGHSLREYSEATTRKSSTTPDDADREITTLRYAPLIVIIFCFFFFKFKFVTF